MQFSYTKEVPKSFSEAVEALKTALANAGFGVLFTINLADTLNTKVGAGLEPYLIMGACNPPLAHRAVQAEHEIGLLLPCNVVVYQKDGKTFVSTILPSAAMSTIDNPAVGAVATEAEAKLKAAIDAV